MGRMAVWRIRTNKHGRELREPKRESEKIPPPLKKSWVKVEKIEYQTKTFRPKRG